jgi:hypothetical protein
LKLRIIPNQFVVQTISTHSNRNKPSSRSKKWCPSGTDRNRTSALVPCGSSDLTAKAHRTSLRPWHHSAPISWSREIYSARDHAEGPHYQLCPGGATLFRPAGATSVPAQPPGCGHHPHWQAPLEDPGWSVSDQLCCQRLWCFHLLMPASSSSLGGS